MKTKKRKQQVNTGKLIVVLIIVVLVLFGAFLGLRRLKLNISERFAPEKTNTAEAAEATIGSISATVTGKGTLSNEDSDTLTLPSAIEVTGYYVAVGDIVSEGDLLASVNASTVLQAMAEKQTEIDEIDEKLAEISEDSLDETVTASVSGRVKQIFAKAGDDVTDVMIRSNALLTLSLDGYMAVEIETVDLQRRDTVAVITEDGDVYDGMVTSVYGGTAVILLTDNGPLYGAEVTVADEEGRELGVGTLFIHEPVSVIGFAGTVEKISVSENQMVSAEDTLFTLTDVSYSANYATLLAKRKTLEEELLNLLTVYREGGVYAHFSGTVTAVSKGTYEAAKSAASSSGSGSVGGFSFGSTASAGASSGSMGSETTISYCPSDTMQVTISVDELDILSLTEGQDAAVYISSLSEDAYAGTVTEIGSTGSSSGGTAYYSVVIRVHREEGMRSGMTATAYITIEGTDNALLIPVDALNETSTMAYVYTTYDEETDTLGGMTEVEVGLRNSKYAEIKSGLAEGDTVYYKEAASEDNRFSFGGGNMPGSFGGGNMPGGFSFGDGGMPSGGFGRSESSSRGGSGTGSSGGFSFGGGNMPGGFGDGNAPGGFSFGN